METVDRTRRVLMVEDDRDAVQIAVSLLRDEPYRLLVATNANDALRLVRLHRPDAILLSWTLPDMTGNDFADLLALDPATADIPLILFGLEPWLFGQKHRLKAAQVVNKTYMHEELAPRVRAALNITPSPDVSAQELARLRDRSLWWQGESEENWRALYRRELSISALLNQMRLGASPALLPQA